MSVKNNGDNNKSVSIDVKNDGVWYDWVPFFRPSFMSTNSGLHARYCRIGNTIHYEAIVKFSPLDVGTNPGTYTAMFLLPVYAKTPSVSSSRPIGTAYFTLLGGGSYVGEVYLQATDDFTDSTTTYSGSVGILQYHRVATTSAPVVRNQLTATEPVSLYGSSSTTYHVIAFSGTYEAA